MPQTLRARTSCNREVVAAVANDPALLVQRSRCPAQRRPAAILRTDGRMPLQSVCRARRRWHRPDSDSVCPAPEARRHRPKDEDEPVGPAPRTMLVPPPDSRCCGRRSGPPIRALQPNTARGRPCRALPALRRWLAVERARGASTVSNRAASARLDVWHLLHVTCVLGWTSIRQRPPPAPIERSGASGVEHRAVAQPSGDASHLP
jgi:hypothetical protein